MRRDGTQTGEKPAMIPRKLCCQRNHRTSLQKSPWWFKPWMDSQLPQSDASRNWIVKQMSQHLPQITQQRITASQEMTCQWMEPEATEDSGQESFLPRKQKQSPTARSKSIPKCLCRRVLFLLLTNSFSKRQFLNAVILSFRYHRGCMNVLCVRFGAPV